MKCGMLILMVGLLAACYAPPPPPPEDIGDDVDPCLIYDCTPDRFYSEPDIPEPQYYEPDAWDLYCADVPTYRGPYDPRGYDRDCADFATQADAQSFYCEAGGPDADPHWMDDDRDGIACELLP